MNLKIAIEFIILSPSKPGYYFAFSLRDLSEMSTKKAISPSPCEKRDLRLFQCTDDHVLNFVTCLTWRQLSGLEHRGPLRQSCSGLC